MAPSLEVCGSPVIDLVKEPMATATVSAVEDISAGKQQAIAENVTLHTVDSLLRHRAHWYPDTVVVSYPSSGIEYVDYTLWQLDVFGYRTAKYYQESIPLPSRASSAEKPMVVALLGPSNLEYLVTMLALIKLGHTVLFLSTRISDAAIESLMRVTGAPYIIADRRYLEAAGRVSQTLSSISVSEIASRAVFEFAIEAVADTRLDTQLDEKIETNNSVYIIHSSGSTGLPKPIFQKQSAAIANYMVSMEMKAFVTLPLYHNHGICNFYRSMYAVKPIHMYNADLPLTQEYLTTTMTQHAFEIFYGVPYALKLLAETAQGIEILRQMKVVMYGGSACPDDLGDLLVNNGVNLIGHYGATEVGQLMTSFRPPGDKAWNYVRENAKLEPFLRWEQRGTNLYECVVLEGWPAKTATSRPDGAYSTKDLFEPHPTIPRAWKYIARLDDTIVLVNGEKFNPVQLEGTIRSDSRVTEAVIFGAGRPYLGALVVPAESTRSMSNAEIIDALWPAIEKASVSIEAYARISKDMICVLPHGIDFPRTDKGSIIRQAFYKSYATEIQEAYDRTEGNSSNAKVFTLPDLQVFLQQTVGEVLGGKGLDMPEDTDFFSLGLDSLQAIRIRAELVKSVDTAGHKLGHNIVFDYPSILKLSSFLMGLQNGDTAADGEAPPIEEQMETLIERYSHFEAPKGTTKGSIVVTGATGSLGAHIVSILAADPTVDRVYCLVRAKSSADALRRVKESMVTRKVYSNLPLSSYKKIIALPCSFADKHLGLSQEVYQEIASSDLRSVIHCAWSVNFNMHLSSFEKGNIAGVQHLIDLCLASAGGASAPATFNFCSSVSAAAGSSAEQEAPETVLPLTWAQNMGYGQSKSVAEHICQRAAQRSGVTARVLRVGQIIADSANGIWNAQEAIPMIFESALTTGCLPSLPEDVSWLPVDTVAQAFAEIATASPAACGSVVTNIANHKTVNWTHDLLPMLKEAGLEFEVVEPKEWIRRLRASEPNPEKNPPIKLVDFFAGKYDKELKDFSSSRTYATEIARRFSPALDGVAAPDQEIINRFITYFKATAWSRHIPASSAGNTSKIDKKTVVFMTGPCRSGRSIIGQAAAEWLDAAFIEGDSLHSRSASKRMASHEAVTDEDRWAWLERIKRRAGEAIDELGYDTVVVSCSALKRACRERLRTFKAGVEVIFVDLVCDKEVLSNSGTMVDSQAADHEESGDYEKDVFPIDAGVSENQMFEAVKCVLGSAL